MKNKDILPYLEEWADEPNCMKNEKVLHKNEVSPPPNVIWIMSDQQRAMSLSCNGDKNAITPNLDMMARYGVNFKKAVSSFPICCPFRGAMLTGLPHHKCVQGHDYSLSEHQKTIAHVFNESGYETVYFGKWHLDGCRNNTMMHTVPPHRRGGFQKWLGFENNNSQWNTWVHGNVDGEEKRFKLKGYETDALTDILVDYIHKKSDEKEAKPFFAVLSVQPPHEPYAAPAESSRKFKFDDIELRPNVPAGEQYQTDAKMQLAHYYAMIENLDSNVGMVLEALRENELDLTTHIIFFSDHGDMMGSHGLYGKVVPYEESIRIPFIISGAVPQFFGYHTTDTDAVICEVDLAPTTLGLCGIKAPQWMEGYDYSHYRFDGSQNFSRQVFKDDEPQSAYIKAIAPREGCDTPWRGVVTRDGYKYVCFEQAPWQLFDLNKDPYEQVNLIHVGKYLPIYKELHGMLQEWIDKTQDNFVLPNLVWFDEIDTIDCSGIRVKFSKPHAYHDDCALLSKILDEIGVNQTDNMEDCDVYLSLDGVNHAYNNEALIQGELDEAKLVGKPIAAVCMVATNGISLKYTSREIPFMRLTKISIGTYLTNFKNQIGIK